MTKIKRIGAVSLGKIMGAMYAAIGLVIGGVVVIFAIIGSVFTSDRNLLVVAAFGLGAIIILPLFYGLIGLVFGTIFGWLYNKVSIWTGGLEIEIQEK